MQTHKLIILLLTITLNSFSQTGIMKGGGLISVEIDNLPTIEFYNSMESENPIKKIKIFDDERIKSFNIKDFEKIRNEWFEPIHIHLDYHIFYLQCCETKNEWYQVIVNESTNLKYWIKKSSDLNYIKWEDFILDAVAVSPENSEENPILISPQCDSNKTEKQPIDCLTPVSVQGEWLKVRVEPAICDMTNEMKENEIFDGYIRWKKGDKLIVKYYLLL